MSLSLMDEHRRQEVAQLLKQGTNSKLLRGGTEIALPKIKEAYRLAIATPTLPPPWPQLAAYRLAHLLLRSNANSELQRVNELFQEATSDNCLGPVPQIYYLAALQRIKIASDNQEECRKIDGQIQEVFQKAYRGVRQLLANQRRDEEGTEEPPERSLLQEGRLNLLELATYFLGLTYEPLEGVGGPYGDLLLGDQQDDGHEDRSQRTDRLCRIREAACRCARHTHAPHHALRAVRLRQLRQPRHHARRVDCDGAGAARRHRLARP